MWQHDSDDPGKIFLGSAIAQLTMASGRRTAVKRVPTREELDGIAMDRDGTCLSRSITTRSEPLAWRCKAGHEFKMRLRYVLDGKWCPACDRQGTRREITLDFLNTIAGDRGGLCLSHAYTSAHEMLEWVCVRGHAWSAPAWNVINGTWCPECARRDRRPVHAIEEMRAAAIARGGECLSSAYISSRERLAWRCSEGHEWLATPSSVLRGKWCRSCAVTSLEGKHHVQGLRKTIDDARRVARERGGACLSEVLVTVKAKLQWRCGRGHEWPASLQEVARGTWCPTCAKPGSKSSQREARLAPSRKEETQQIKVSRLYVTGSKQARFITARHIDAASEANAKLVVNHVVDLHDAGEILPLRVPPAVLDGYLGGTVTARTMLAILYGEPAACTLGSLHAPSGDVIGRLVVSCHEIDHAVTVVDLFLDRRFHREAFVRPVWNWTTILATTWFHREARPFERARPGRYTPPAIHEIITNRLRVTCGTRRTCIATSKKRAF
jgi:hypothetical protein